MRKNETVNSSEIHRGDFMIDYRAIDRTIDMPDEDICSEEKITLREFIEEVNNWATTLEEFTLKEFTKKLSNWETALRQLGIQDEKDSAEHWSESLLKYLLIKTKKE
jgi:hypothetical protein